MEQTTGPFSLPTLLRKKIEKRRRQEKDLRIHQRLSALLWLNEGFEVGKVAHLLDVCPRTVRNWVALYHSQGLDGLCTLEYQGDPG